MRALTASEMLEVWDTAALWSPARRALALLRAAMPEMAAEVLGRLSIGARDAGLLSLREWFFGPRVVGRTACPVCAEQLECVFDIDDVRVAAPEPALDEPAYRLPDSTDLEAIAASPDEASALRMLVQRCIPNGPSLRPGQVQALAEEMARRDPQACTEINLTCQACHHEWAIDFDIAVFFWTEIHAWAQRTLREVHALATAYGWSEQAILGLSAPRRQAYLELIGE